VPNSPTSINGSAGQWRTLLPLSVEQLSRAVSHALRHEPWLYELELDAEGWAPIGQLLDALHAKGGPWTEVDLHALVAMIESSAKQRHELVGDKIRALYGHSLPGRIVRKPAQPPEFLFHGTAPETYRAIRHAGLLPMGRQYVHLSNDIETGLAVGRRKSKSPIVLRVAAAEAAQVPIAFYEGNNKVWLAAHVPAQFIQCLNCVPGLTTAAC
jgi:putative RNA 2'-phosphotransferase